MNAFRTRDSRGVETRAARCLGGWKVTKRYPPRDPDALEWVQTTFRPTDDAEMLADALAR